MQVQEEKLLQYINPQGTAPGIQRPPFLLLSSLFPMHLYCAKTKQTFPLEKALLEDYYEGDLKKLHPTSTDPISTSSAPRPYHLTLSHKEPLIKQLCSGLLTTFKKKILHGDIKPENIFVHGLMTSPPLFHIADFGGALNEVSAPILFEQHRFDTNEIDNEKVREKSVITLRGAFTPDYHPEIRGKQLPDGATEEDLKKFVWSSVSKEPGSEYDALAKGDFNAWVKARKKAILFALTTTIEEVCVGLLGERDRALLGLLKTTTDPDKTLQDICSAWETAAST